MPVNGRGEGSAGSMEESDGEVRIVELKGMRGMEGTP